MKQIAPCFVLALSILILGACGIARKPYGDSGKCELHGLSLHKSVVRVKYGFCCAPGTHLGMGSENFPNAKHPICGGCSVQAPFRRMYNCRKCNRAHRSYVFSRKDSLKQQTVRAKF